MTDHFNKLTPAEAERLALLIEEMAEAQHVACKILRHGYESRHPNGGWTNRQLLEKEVGHVIAAFDMMFAADDMDPEFVERLTKMKQQDVKQWLHHQEKRNEQS